jgi:hypothetical protein
LSPPSGEGPASRRRDAPFREAGSSGHNLIPPGDNSWTVGYSHRSEHGRGPNRLNDNCHRGGLYCQACSVSGSRAPKATLFGTPAQSNRIPWKRPRMPSRYPSRNQRPQASSDGQDLGRTSLSVDFCLYATGRPPTTKDLCDVDAFGAMPAEEGPFRSPFSGGGTERSARHASR